MPKSIKILLIVLVVLLVLSISYYLIFILNKKPDNQVQDEQLIKQSDDINFSVPEENRLGETKKSVIIENIKFNIPENYQLVELKKDSLPKELDKTFGIKHTNGETIIYIGYAKDIKSIGHWEENICTSEVFCKNFDDKDLQKDGFDEHYWYRYSGDNWENIRINNMLVMIYHSYIQGEMENQEELISNIISSLEVNK